MADEFKLRDDSTGFADPETGLKVVRGQIVEVGERRGKLTSQAIAAGRLIEVRTPLGEENVEEDPESPADESVTASATPPARSAKKAANRRRK